jgi:DNA-binding response OmpR family regulator
MRLLLVEDDKWLSKALVFQLKEENYTVDVASDGITGLELALAAEYDLALLDRMLPGLDGIEVLKRIRAAGKRYPVLFITARDAIEDRIGGLDAGADDYLVKPFSTGEMLARVRALCRRPQVIVENEMLQFGELELNPRTGALLCRAGRIELTSRESGLMELLMRHKGQVLTREVILDRVWGLADEVEPGNVDTYIHFLRKKLQALDAGVTIRTLRGIGFCLERK